jgi:CDP-glucose 4,6-dehydratase
MENLEMSPFNPVNSSFWQGKRVLLTGHTGFKGAWMALWLHRMGAQVTGISLPPPAQPNLFTLARIDQFVRSHFCDIRHGELLTPLIQQAQPEIVFHLAAQALVRASYRNPVETFATNVMGTAHVLDALREMSSPRVAVMITTDKVYHNNEGVWPYREDDALGGHDPYSASKAACETVIASYRDSFFRSKGLAVASARAGNVIGGGDWSPDRLIPDAVRAWQADEPLQIRRPDAVRPWQHVLEPLAGYLTLAEKLWQQPELAGAYNFGPHTHEAATVRDVIELARISYGRGATIFGDGTQGPHEAGWLALEIAKARQVLGVHPKLTLTQSVESTMAWYQAQAAGADARTLCETDIAAYEAAE